MSTISDKASIKILVGKDKIAKSEKHVCKAFKNMQFCNSYAEIVKFGLT